MKELSIENILARAAFESVPVFKSDYHGTGYINTGGSYDEIRAEDNRIKAPISIHTLVFGRNPGTYPPFGFEKGTQTPTDLMQWCMDRFGETTKEARSTSFLIARKLKDEGNRVYRGTTPPIPIEGTVGKANEVVFNEVLNNLKEAIKSHDL